MAFAFYMRKEVENFIKFAKGRSNFVDVGAAEGFYSALFASINGARSNIVSIDGGVGCQAAIRERVRACNLAHHEVKEWRLVNVYLTGDDQKKLFETPPGVETVRFVDAMSSLPMTPDFIKFDIESLEYEILVSESATEWLSKNRPILMIELHNRELKERGLSCEPILDRLQSIGYRVVAADTAFYKRRSNTHVILRAA
jgi:FkbM family methyltransferase